MRRTAWLCRAETPRRRSLPQMRTSVSRPQPQMGAHAHARACTPSLRSQMLTTARAKVHARAHGTLMDAAAAARPHARTHTLTNAHAALTHARTHECTRALTHSRTCARTRALTHARTLGTSAWARARTSARADGQADRAGRGRTVFGRGRGMAREAGCVALTVTAVGCARPVSELPYASWGMRGQRRPWRGCALHVTPWRGAWCPKQPGPVKTGQPAGFGAGGHESAEQRSCRRQCVYLFARLLRVCSFVCGFCASSGGASAMGIGSWHSSSVPCCAQTDVLGVLSAGRSCQRANRNRSGIPRGS